MKITYNILILMFFLMFIQCSNKEILLSGTYRESEILKTYNNQIELYDDSTFVYKYLINSRTERYSNGKWKQSDKNTIVLNSNIQNYLAMNSVEIISVKNKKSVICINLNIQNKNPKDYICFPVFDDKVFADISPSGNGSYCLYSEVPLKKAYFKIEKRPQISEVLGMMQPSYNIIESETVIVDNQIGDSIIFNLQTSDSLFTYRIFKDMELKLKNNSLIFNDKNNRKKHKLKLIK